MHFVVLVDKIRIYEEDIRENATHYKSLNVKKGKGKFRGKSYVDKGKQKTAEGNKSSGGRASISITCYQCGVAAHRDS